MPRKFDPETLYAAQGLYHNAVEVQPGERIVYSSGIVGCRPDGSLPDSPEAHIQETWRNVARFLDGVGMTADNLVRLKMHLTDQALVPVSRAARIDALGEHMNAAVMGVVCELFYPEYVIEIEVVAAS